MSCMRSIGNGRNGGRGKMRRERRNFVTSLGMRAETEAEGGAGDDDNNKIGIKNILTIESEDA